MQIPKTYLGLHLRLFLLFISNISNVRFICFTVFIRKGVGGESECKRKIKSLREYSIFSFPYIYRHLVYYYL